MAFALDALAIAAQALVGKELGAGDTARVRAATDLMVRWGLVGGAVLGLLVIAFSGLLPGLFTSDPLLQHAITAGLIVAGLGQPLAGYVFVIDGVLIGAGDGPWLARAQVVTLAAYLPLALGLAAIGSWSVGTPPTQRIGSRPARKQAWTFFAIGTSRTPRSAPSSLAPMS